MGRPREVSGLEKVKNTMSLLCCKYLDYISTHYMVVKVIDLLCQLDSD